MEQILFSPAEHEALKPIAWDAPRAQHAIHEICQETDRAFREEDFWVTHPSDEDWNPGVPMTSLFWGAGATVWTLLTLQERKAIPKLSRDYSATLESIYETYCKQPDSGKLAPGYLFGETGLLTLRYRFTPSPSIADRLYEVAKETVPRPELELMWGAPGTILASRFMLEKTGEARWADLIREAASHLIDTWTTHPESGVRIWNQQLYGMSRHFLGAVHGFAGNVTALLLAAPSLSSETHHWVLSETQRTVAQTAIRQGALTNWLPSLESAPEDILVQWCHGAPGIITGLSQLPLKNSPELETLFQSAGELIWKAGPLRKPFGLCHGTAGNAMAFLTLYRRTQNSQWLERARTFAMHALEQSEAQRKLHGRRRYALLTGDLGLAYALWCCLQETDAWPLIDLI